MSENVKSMKGRFQNKHKTEAQWWLDVYDTKGNLRKDAFVPLNGELIVFDEDEQHDYKRFKFGDGQNNVIKLDWSSGVPFYSTTKEKNFRLHPSDMIDDPNGLHQEIKLDENTSNFTFTFSAETIDDYGIEGYIGETTQKYATLADIPDLIIGVKYFSWGDEDYIYTVWVKFDKSTHTIYVDFIGYNHIYIDITMKVDFVQSIDAKYLPIDNDTIITDGNGKLKTTIKQADWNQFNELAPNYIKNKTHGINYIVKTEATAQNGSYDEDYYTGAPLGGGFATSVHQMFLPGTYIDSMGNIEVVEPGDNFDDFENTGVYSLFNRLLFIENDDNVSVDTKRAKFPYTLKLYQEDGVKQLDTKYIPVAEYAFDKDSDGKLVPQAGGYGYKVNFNIDYFYSYDDIRHHQLPLDRDENGAPVFMPGIYKCGLDITTLTENSYGIPFTPADETDGVYSVFAYESLEGGQDGIRFEMSSNGPGISSIEYTSLGGFKQFDSQYIPIDNKTITTDVNGKLKTKQPTLTELGGVKAVVNGTGANAVPFMNNGKSHIDNYKKYTADATPGTLVYRDGTGGRFFVNEATAEQHPVPKVQMDKELAKKVTINTSKESKQTVYITDPQGDQSYKKYTSEAYPATIVHREGGLNTFNVGDPVFNSHPVTMNFGNARYFPVQKTSDLKIFETFNPSALGLEMTEIGADSSTGLTAEETLNDWIAKNLKHGQKLFTSESAVGNFNTQNVLSIVPDPHSEDIHLAKNVICATYTYVDDKGKVITSQYSPELSVGRNVDLGDGDSFWEECFRIHTNIDGKWDVTYKSPAYTYAAASLLFEIPWQDGLEIRFFDVANYTAAVGSVVLIQDPRGNPSYKPYTQFAEYGTIPMRSSSGSPTFEVGDPVNAQNPVTLNYANSHYEVKKGSSAGPDSVAIMEAADKSKTYSWGDKYVHYYKGNGRFNVADPIGSLHPVNKRTMEKYVKEYIAALEERIAALEAGSGGNIDMSDAYMFDTAIEGWRQLSESEVSDLENSGTWGDYNPGTIFCQNSCGARLLTSLDPGEAYNTAPICPHCSGDLMY